MIYESFLEGTEPPESAAAISPDYNRELYLTSIDWKRSIDNLFTYIYNSTGDDFSAPLPVAPGPANHKLLWQRKRTKIFNSPSDFYGFRQVRSEHLFARIRQNFLFTGV
jgi:hypothetical protein